MVTMLYTHLITDSLYPLSNIFSTTPLQTLGNHPFTLCFYVFDIFEKIPQIRPYSVYLSLNYYFIHVVLHGKISLFLRLNNISIYLPSVYSFIS